MDAKSASTQPAGSENSPADKHPSPKPSGNSCTGQYAPPPTAPHTSTRRPTHLPPPYPPRNSPRLRPYNKITNLKRSLGLNPNLPQSQLLNQSPLINLLQE